MTLGLYLPGTSPLHRAPAGLKLALLVSAGVVSVFLDAPWQVLVGLGVVAVLYGVAGISLSVALAQVRPLRFVGVDPARVGLLLALGIRCVPVVVGLAHEVRDAQRARGLAASPRAFVVPLIVRSLRHADALGEALVARGAEDPLERLL